METSLKRTAAQVGKSSRSKGQRGERELAALLTEVTGHTITRMVHNRAGDADLEGLPYWSIECKRHSTVTPFKLWEWWAQTVDSARARQLLPVLFYKPDRGQWTAVWNADLHKVPQPPAMRPDIENTLCATPQTWWDLCKRMTNRRG